MPLSPKTARTARTALAVAVVAVCAIVAALLVPGLLRSPDRLEIVAEFTGADGIHTGSQVRLLGVEVGTVESVEPAGDIARVHLSVDPDTELPADVGAVIMNPAVIADRFVELTPGYTGGERLESRAVIGPERTRAPLAFDAFVSSLDTVASAFAPHSAATARSIEQGAEVLGDRGPQLHQALRDLGSVTSTVRGGAPDLAAVVADLDVLLTAAGGRDDELRELVVGLDALGRELDASDADVGATTQSLRVAFDEIDRLLEARGEDITAATTATEDVTELFASKRPEFAEFFDLYPLMMSNLDRSIGPDGRARIRLNVSSNITHFERGREVCAQRPLPVCMGAGLTNPLVFPVDQRDPIGIRGALEQLMPDE